MRIIRIQYGARAFLRLAVAAAALLCAAAAAQSLSDVRRPSEPLVLSAQGSFFIAIKWIDEHVEEGSSQSGDR